jgi:hypothetical protein
MNPPIKEDIHHLTWNASGDCIFEATITNNKISSLHFCAPPAKNGEERICLNSIDEAFFRQVVDCGVELLRYMDDLRSKTGTFKLDEVEASKVKLDEITEAP